MKRILVVDDDAQIVNSLCEYLGSFGYDVDFAYELEEARALIDRRDSQVSPFIGSSDSARQLNEQAHIVDAQCPYRVDPRYLARLRQSGCFLGVRQGFPVLRLGSDAHTASCGKPTIRRSSCAFTIFLRAGNLRVTSCCYLSGTPRGVSRRRVIVLTREARNCNSARWLVSARRPHRACSRSGAAGPIWRLLLKVL